MTSFSTRNEQNMKKLIDISFLQFKSVYFFKRALMPDSLLEPAFVSRIDEFLILSSLFFQSCARSAESRRGTLDGLHQKVILPLRVMAEHALKRPFSCPALKGPDMQHLH